MPPSCQGDVFKAASVPRVEVETSPIAASSTPYVVKDLVPVMPADQTNKKDKDVTVEERESSGASCGEWERLFGDFWAAGVISCFLGILEGFSVAIYIWKKSIPFEQ